MTSLRKFIYWQANQLKLANALKGKGKMLNQITLKEESSH